MSDTANIFDHEPDFDTFGGRLQRAREASDLSVKDLAWRLGVMTKTVQGWECDRDQPSSHRMTKLAGLTNVSLSWLMHGIGEGPTDDTSDGALPADVDRQLTELRQLHAQTGQLIGKIQSDLDRLKPSAAA